MPEELVVSVVDGDTIRTYERWGRIRILGYNTPERNKPGFTQARDALVRLILHKRVFVTCISRDIYGRALCYVFLDNGGKWENVAVHMKPYARKF